MRTAALREPWPDLERQKDSAVLGIWLFLGTEVLFFGGLFAAYAIYRFIYPGFVAGARESAIAYGSINTAILLTSSFAMAVGVRAARARLNWLARPCFYGTAVLGAGFLLLKGFEYRDDIARHLVPGPGFPIAQSGAEIFWALYWIMTVVHAVHVAIGVGAVLRLPIAGNDVWLAESPAAEVTGLYWHFVDVIWVFLFPLLYLGGRA